MCTLLTSKRFYEAQIFITGDNYIKLRFLLNVVKFLVVSDSFICIVFQGNWLSFLHTVQNDQFKANAVLTDSFKNRLGLL